MIFMPESNCKYCKHYFDGYKGAVQPRCKLVMDRIKSRIEEGNATADEVRYYCGFGDFNPDWICEKYEQKQESTEVSWTWDESKKALIDICEALTFEPADYNVYTTPQELFKKIFLKLYYIANYVSIWTEDKTEDYEEYEDHTLEWLKKKGYDIPIEELRKARTDAENFAVWMWTTGKVAKSPFNKEDGGEEK